MIQHLTQSIQMVADDQEESVPFVSNQQIADVLFNIATILQMQQDNPYRIEAYRNAARGITAMGEPAAPVFIHGEVPPILRLGERLRRKITELVTTGSMTFYDHLCEESLPPDARDLMRVPHVGPRTALRLTGQLHIHSVAELYQAATCKSLREHFGFGARSEERLRAGALVVLLGETPVPSAPAPAA